MIQLPIPFLFDGGTGTYLQELLPELDYAVEECNIYHPETVLSLHREYIEAGAMGIKTNTFGANTVALSMDFSEVRKIITQGIALAKEAVREGNTIIFADIGPIGTALEQALEEYKWIIDCFLEEGINHFLFETFPSGEYFETLSEYIKGKCKESYILVSFAVFPSGETRLGLPAKSLLLEMDKIPHIDAIGLNCISGPHHLMELAKKLPTFTKPLSLMPNANYPTIIGGKAYYEENPIYFSQELSQGKEFSVRIFGGCCGTTPSYTKALKEGLTEVKPIKREVQSVSARMLGPKTENSFLEKLKAKEFPIVVEYDPPADLNIRRYMENVRYLRELGVDGITLADCPVARARIDASIMGVKIKRETGVEPIIHMTCRDRNINATKALLLGLAMEEIQNILLVTGDPIPTAERDEVKAVFQLNSVRLASFVQRLNEEVLEKPMNIGAALNINAVNFTAELDKAKRKEEAGVQVFYTQPVLSEIGVNNLSEARKNLQGHIMGGLIPVVSYRNAHFMQSEISGITMEEQVLQSFTEDMTKDEAGRLGVKWTRHFMEKIIPYVDGLYLITPFHRVELIGDILK